MTSPYALLAAGLLATLAGLALGPVVARAGMRAHHRRRAC